MSTHEERVRDEIANTIVKYEAARILTAGNLKAARITRYIGVLGALVPVVGFVWIGILTVVSIILSFVVVAKGNHKDGLISLIVTIGVGIASVFVWGLVNLAVIALFSGAGPRL